MKTQTIVRELQVKMQSSNEKLVNLLKCSEFDINEQIFNLGLSFLRKQCGCENDSYHAISSQRVYWNWFKNQYRLAADEIIEMMMTFSNSTVAMNRNLFEKHMQFEINDSPRMITAFDNFLKMVLE